MIKIHPQLLDFVRPSEHSTYSPSGIDMWIEDGCPYSIKGCANIPEERSNVADEGTLAHSVAENYFYQAAGVKAFPPELNLQMFQLPDKGQEMMDGAKFYSDTLCNWLTFAGIGKILGYWLEKGVPIFPEKGAFGTADCLIIGELGAVIIDYKYGKKPVRPDSKQLRVYAAGVARHLIDMPAEYKFFSVIVQPRTDWTAKVHEYSSAEIMEFLDKIWRSIELSEQPNLEPVRGSHCFWCKASRTKDPALKCPAIKKQAEDALKNDFGSLLADMNAPVENLSTPDNHKRDAAMLKIMAMLPLLQSIATDAEAEFMYRISSGENIAGLSIQEVLGNRQWRLSADDDMSNEIKKFFPEVNPIKEVKSTKLKTIGEIEKEVGKGVIDHLTIKKSSKKLVVQTEKQKEVLGELAAFGNLMIANQGN